MPNEMWKPDVDLGDRHTIGKRFSDPSGLG